MKNTSGIMSVPTHENTKNNKEATTKNTLAFSLTVSPTGKTCDMVKDQ